MRAGARERDGSASGNTAPLRFAALFRPSGTFSREKAREKGNVMLATHSSKQALQGVEAALEHALPDILGKLRLASGFAVELGRPFGEAAIAVGDRRQLERRHIVRDTQRAFEDGIGAAQIEIGKSEQP